MFKNIKTAAFDLDGTIYYGSKIIDGALDVINALKSKGIKVIFVTNNSTKVRSQVADKLNGMGINCTEEDIMTAAYASACFAKEHELKNLYISGTDMLKKEFADIGVSYTEIPEEAENLIIGCDSKYTYDKMTLALRAGLNAKHIYSCNTDRHFLGEGQKSYPGCGAMVAAIEWCCNKKCDAMIGKPGTYMLEFICKTNGLENEELIMIGDTYETDIAMAKEKGCPSILIGNGYSDTVCVDKISDILNMI